MRRYTAEEEARERTASRLRAWQRSGLVDEGQANVMAIDLDTGLKRTNLVLRIVLFGFASLVLQSGVFLVAMVSGLESEAAGAIVTLTASAVSMALAESLVTQFRLYRFGVEEAAAVWAVALAVASVMLWASVFGVTARPERIVIVAAATGAAALYARFGYLYAALVAAGCAAAVPFMYGLSGERARVVAVAILLAIGALAAVARRPHRGEYPGDDYGMVHALSWLAAYAVLTVALVEPGLSLASSPGVRWGTFAATWALAVATFVLGVRGRHTALLRAGLAMLVASLATAKLYLLMPIHEWDPILLGLVLAVSALAARRWLSSGPGGARAGYTPRALLDSDERSVASLGMVAGLAQGAASAPAVQNPPGYEPGGGSSGGAGASGRF